MMTNPYTDPAAQVHQEQAIRAMGQPQQFLPPLQPVLNPLDNLPRAQNEIIYGNGNNQSRPPTMSLLESMAAGAVIGYLIGGMFAKRREARKQRKQQHVQELKESLGVEES